jgi:hypothetical protein
MSIWPHPDTRLAKILVATFGALAGSLIGRVLADPGWLGYAMFVAGGAFVFSCADWARRRMGATPVRNGRLDGASPSHQRRRKSRSSP